MKIFEILKWTNVCIYREICYLKKEKKIMDMRFQINVSGKVNNEIKRRDFFILLKIVGKIRKYDN